LDYKEFAYHIFGIGGKPQLDSKAKSIVERVKATILERGGVSGLHGVARVLKRMDTDGSGNLDKVELLNGLKDYGIVNITPAELQTLFRYQHFFVIEKENGTHG